MRMNKKKEIVPKLRFPEFQGNAIDFVYGNKLFESITNKNHNFDLPILAITQDQGAVSREQIEYNVTVTDKSLSNYKIVEVGDFIISLRSFQGGIEYSRIKGICSPAYIILRKREENISELYYKYFFKTWKYIQSLNRNLEGIRDGKMISYSQFSSVKVPYPRSFKEQQKIADCLSSIDDLIDAESRKLKALEKYKKGLMQKLFPAEGKTLPEWRFPEFQACGEWKLQKLGQVCDFQEGYAFSSNDFVKINTDSNHIQVVRITDINNKNSNTDKVFVNMDLIKNNDLYKYLISKNDLVLSLTGAAGFNFFMWNTNIAVLNQRTLKLIPKDEKNHAIKFLIEPLIHKEINMHGTGQNNNLSKEVLKNVEIVLPTSCKEQQKIADCLSEFNTMITEQSNKIEQLKAHKKGLMQGLFPSLEEEDI